MSQQGGAGRYNRNSHAITEGDNRAPNRAMLRAVGFRDEDFGKPILGVADSQSDITPCNAGLGDEIAPGLDPQRDAAERGAQRGQAALERVEIERTLARPLRHAEDAADVDPAEPQATPENVAALRHDLGLDQPIWLRYLGWLWHILQGDFGRSFRTGQTVWQAVSERVPVSFELMILAELIGLAIGVPLAIACAAKAGSAFVRFMTGSAFGMLSVPTFLSAILLIYLFAVELRMLPATGYVPFTEDPVANLRFMVLPALTLGLAEWPGIMRVLRSDMIAALQED